MIKITKHITLDLMSEAWTVGDDISLLQEETYVYGYPHNKEEYKNFLKEICKYKREEPFLVIGAKKDVTKWTNYFKKDPTCPFTWEIYEVSKYLVNTFEVPDDEYGGFLEFWTEKV